jgi:hypothetical protein
MTKISIIDQARYRITPLRFPQKNATKPRSPFRGLKYNRLRGLKWLITTEDHAGCDPIPKSTSQPYLIALAAIYFRLFMFFSAICLIYWSAICRQDRCFQSKYKKRYLAPLEETGVAEEVAANRCGCLVFHFWQTNWTDGFGSALLLLHWLYYIGVSNITKIYKCELHQ